MSIITVEAARLVVRQANPNQLYLLQHPDHMDSALQAAGIDLADLTSAEREQIRRDALALWADYGTADESRG